MDRDGVSFAFFPLSPLPSGFLYWSGKVGIMISASAASRAVEGNRIASAEVTVADSGISMLPPGTTLTVAASFSSSAFSMTRPGPAEMTVLPSFLPSSPDVGGSLPDGTGDGVKTLPSTALIWDGASVVCLEAAAEGREEEKEVGAEAAYWLAEAVEKLLVVGGLVGDDGEDGGGLRLTFSSKRSTSAAFLPLVERPRSPSSSWSCLTVFFSNWSRDSRTAETRVRVGCWCCWLLMLLPLLLLLLLLSMTKCDDAGAARDGDG